jgi:hypothetical protein
MARRICQEEMDGLVVWQEYLGTGVRWKTGGALTGSLWGATFRLP